MTKISSNMVPTSNINCQAVMQIEKKIIECLEQWHGGHNCRRKMLDLLDLFIDPDNNQYLKDIQRIIAELRPELYLVVARLFINARILSDQISAVENIELEPNFDRKLSWNEIEESLNYWFLRELSYILQYFWDLKSAESEDSINSVANQFFEEAICDLRSIISIFVNSINQKRSKAYIHGGKLAVKSICEALARTEIPPDSVFNIEDKLFAVDFKRQRFCAFGKRAQINEFRSQEAIHIYLKSNYCSPEELVGAFTHHKTQLIINQITDSSSRLVVNWLPYAEQIPFSWLFGIVRFLADYHKISFSINYKPVKFSEALSFLENEELSLVISNNKLAELAPQGNYYSHNLRGEICFATAPLLRYSEYGVLIKRETLDSLLFARQATFKKGQSLLLNWLQSKSSQAKLFYGAGEFPAIAKEAGLNIRHEVKDVAEPFTKFLSEPNAVYFDGSVQIRYLAELFKPRVYVFENLLSTSSVKSHLLTSARLPTEHKEGEFGDVSPIELKAWIEELWCCAEMLTKELLNPAIVENSGPLSIVADNFRFDMSLYSTDLIVSNFANVKEAFNGHSRFFREKD